MIAGMTAEDCRAYALRFEPTAKRITFACGHKETYGGNFADPACLLAELGNAMIFEDSQEICSECKKVGE